MEVIKRQLQWEHIGRWSQILGAGACILFGFYLIRIQDDWFRITSSFLSALCLLLAPYVFRKWVFQLSNETAGKIELILLVMLGLNGAGALGFYRTTQYYDLGLHVVGPFLAGLAVSLILHEVSNVRETLHHVAARTIMIVLGLILLWELYEWGTDMLLGTAMFGQEGEEYDTVYDIVAGTLAMVPLHFLILYTYPKLGRKQK